MGENYLEYYLFNELPKPNFVVDQICIYLD